MKMLLARLGIFFVEAWNEAVAHAEPQTPKPNYNARFQAIVRGDDGSHV